MFKIIIRRVGVRALSAALVAVVVTGAAADGAAGRASSKPVASAKGAVHVTLTTRTLSYRLTTMPDLTFGRHSTMHTLVIAVDDHARYQRIRGFGAAMTDSSAWLLEKQLPRAARAAVMRDLFGTQGIHLGFLRVPMGASDFTATGTPYSYDDMPPGQSDPTLSNFSIAHDRAYVLPALRAALAVNPSLDILANPWSPPGWMKANDSLANLGDMGTVPAENYSALAQYFVRFLKAYAAQHAPVREITVQNEPGVVTAYPGAYITADAEATFTSQYLVPALRSAGLPTRVYGNDLSWNVMAFPTSLESGPAAPDLAGIAWHCYKGDPDQMGVLHAQFPAADQVVSECSPEILGFSAVELLISSLRNWASTVAVWNVALDPQGGPVQAPDSGCHGCTGVVTVSEATHRVRPNAKYYQIGQVSKFVQRGAVRIGSTSTVAYTVPGVHKAFRVSPGIDSVAFVNPNRSKVLVVSNTSTATGRFAVRYHGKSFSYTLPAGAVVTFTWR
jgi:O-glycosyl hydrolase